MSNYDWQTDKSGTFRIGAEVVNGTGQLVIRSADERDLYAEMTADEALELASTLANQAFEAKRVQWRTAHLANG